MKFFIDTADVNEIRKAWEHGMCDGVTTNPSLIKKSGRDFKTVISEIAEFVEGPISAETTSRDAQEMIAQGRELHTWGKNIMVKVPMTTEGIKAVKTLSSEDIQTNVTLIFSANQALVAAKAGATVVSPFLGRLDDIGQPSMEVIEDMAQIYGAQGFDTEILVASVRNPIHVLESAKLGADIVTLPPKVLWQLFQHPLTDSGLEKFMADYESTKELQTITK